MAYCVSGIVLGSGGISMNKRNGVPAVLMSGRKINLQQTHIIFNPITLCALEEKTCIVYYEYKNEGNLAYSRHQWRFPWERLIETMLSLLNVSSIFSRKTCLWDLWAAISRKHIGNITLWKVAMPLPWAIFWKYLLTFTLHFGSRACLAPNVHSLCSSLPETREVNISLRRAQTPASTTASPHLTGNHRVFMGLEGFATEPSLSHRETYQQRELMELWTLWEDMTPVPQAAVSGIHRGDGPWPSPHCPTACGGKVLFPHVILSQRTAPPPFLPDDGWDDTCHPSFRIQYRSTHTLPWVSVLLTCLMLFSVYHHPLLSRPQKSLLISDSPRTLAKPLQTPVPFSFPDSQKHILTLVSPKLGGCQGKEMFDSYLHADWSTFWKDNRVDQVDEERGGQFRERIPYSQGLPGVSGSTLPCARDEWPPKRNCSDWQMVE